MTRTCRFIVTAVALALAGACTTPAVRAQIQANPLMLTMAVDPPYSPYLEEWRKHPERIHLTIQNTDVTHSFEIRLRGSLTTEDGRIRIFTKDNIPVRRIVVPAGGTLLCDGRDYPLFDPNMIDATGVDRNEIARSGRLPEGNALVCVQALDYSTLAPLSAASPLGCTIMPILLAEPPRIISPVCGSSLYSITPQLLTFQWTPSLVGVPPERIPMIRYEIMLVPVLNNVNPEEALRSPGEPVFFRKSDLLTTQYIYTQADPQLEAGKLYAWRVRAYDALGSVVFRDNGVTPACSFRMQTPSTFCFALTTVEPTNDAFLGMGSTPKFKVHASRQLDTGGVTGGMLRIWRMTDQRENLTAVMARTPDLQRDFTGNSDEMIILESLADTATDITVRGVYAGDSSVFSATQGWFAWNFILRHKTTVMKNGSLCTRTVTQSNDGTFGYTPCFTVRAFEPVGFRPTPESKMPLFQVATSPRVNAANFIGSSIKVWAVPDDKVKPNATDVPEAAFGNGLIGNIFKDAFGYGFSGVEPRTTDPKDTVLNLLVINHPEVPRVATKTWKPKPYQWYAWKVGMVSYPFSNIVPDGPICTQPSASTDMVWVRFSPNSCLAARGISPEDKGTWKDGLRPRFMVEVSPPINKSGILGGVLRIYEMNSPGENTDDVVKRGPIYDEHFLGNDESQIIVLKESGGSSQLDLTFVNVIPKDGPDRRDPKLVQGKSYLWSFSLDFKKEEIRQDKVVCTVETIESEYASFKLDTSKPACEDACSVPLLANKAPATKVFQIGDILRVGAFKMQLTSVTTNAGVLKGSGTIPVKFLGSVNIAVDFMDIKVNDNNEVYDGDITAQQIENAPLAPELANVLEGPLGMDDKAISSVYNAATNVARMASYFLGTPAKMPFGWDNEVMGHKVTLAIMGMVFKPTAAYLNAVVSVMMPEWGENIGIGLGARRICFNETTLGGDGKYQFYLPVDVGYTPTDTAEWGVRFLAPSAADSGCFVGFECGKFKDLHLTMQLEFPRHILRPYPVDNGKKVKATFRAVMARGWNFMAAASLERCELSDYPDWVLEVKEMTYDHSVVENPYGMSFPKGFLGDTTRAWTGFFIKRLSLSIPAAYNSASDGKPLQIAVQDVMLGKGGFCASIRAENVIQYPNACLGGWGAGIDTIFVNFFNSSLQSGGFTGNVHVPLVKSPFAFRGMVSCPLPTDPVKKVRWSLVIKPDSMMSIDAFQCRAEFAKTSSITIGNDNPQAEWRGVAMLSGALGITKSVGGVPNIYIVGIKFENMRIQSVAPKFTLGNIGLASPQKGLAGFPISITNIGFVDEKVGGVERNGLSFDLNLNLTGGVNGFGGSTTLIIWGKMVGEATNPSFEYDDISLKAVSIHADLKAFKIAGSLTLFSNDTVYGTGFRGQVEMEVCKVWKAVATAQFGRVSRVPGVEDPKTEYWACDLNVQNSKGTPMFLALGWYALGGGFWYNMERLDTAKTGTGKIDPSKMMTQSPLVPKEGHYGGKLQITFGTYPNSATFNMDLAAEVQVYGENGSLHFGSFRMLGPIYCLADITQRPSAKVRGYIDMGYSVDSSVFHGIFGAAITMPPVTGGGQGVFHIGSPWYLKVGEPSDPFSLSLTSWLPKAQAYLMMGQNLPAPVALPEKITSVLGVPVQVRPASIEAGSGIVFGALVSWSTGRKTLGPFYAMLDLYGGFDITMLKQKKCPGILGWQAQGKLYAYANGVVGIYVNIGACLGYPCWRGWRLKWCSCCCWGYKGNFDIFNVTAAMLLEMGGLNPTWAKGAVYGKYRILGGLVKGTCNFTFSAGQECRI